MSPPADTDAGTVIKSKGNGKIKLRLYRIYPSFRWCRAKFGSRLGGALTLYIRRVGKLVKPQCSWHFRRFAGRPYREQRATLRHPSCAWQFHSDSWRVSDRPGNRLVGIRGTLSFQISREFSTTFDSTRRVYVYYVIIDCLTPSIAIFQRIIFSTKTYTYQYTYIYIYIENVRIDGDSVPTKTCVVIIFFFFF